MIFNLIADWLIAKSRRTPYFHLQHADGSMYMARYWLVPFTHDAPGCYTATWWKQPIIWLLQRLDIAVRVHHICTPDLDRALHDHPWSFISVVLKGGYSESRPYTISPCFDIYGEEVAIRKYRRPGSVAFRHATDRHRITYVYRNTWTLFITFKKRQWWGFYTPAGKIYYRDYESVHNKEAIR